jgi:hypothetical protein
MESLLPDAWIEAIVNPVSKHDKDCCKANSYRSFSLTSCPLKGNAAHVEPSGRLDLWGPKPSLQSPMRIRKSLIYSSSPGEPAMPHKNVFLLCGHLVGVFSDLQKLYRTAWQQALLRNLNSLHVRGRRPRFLSNLFQSVWAMCYLREIFKEVKCPWITLKSDAVRNRRKLSGKCIWAVCSHTFVYGRHRYLLQQSKHYHHHAPSSGRYGICVSVGPEGWIFVFRK